MSRSFVEILNDAGIETEAYSGRGMGGKECLSVRDIEPLDLFADVLVEVLASDDEPLDEVALVTKVMRNVARDSMGKGIVVYFPGIKPGDEADPNEDPDSDVYFPAGMGPDDALGSDE